MASVFGVDREADFNRHEREEPEAIFYIYPNGQTPNLANRISDEARNSIKNADWYGKAQSLSMDYHPWPVIHEAADATAFPGFEPLSNENPKTIAPPQPSAFSIPSAKIILQRRSAVDFNPKKTTTLEKFQQILIRTLPANSPPWDALYWPPQVHLLLFVHRVEGLAPGLYLLLRDPDDEKNLRAAIRNRFTWQRVDNVHKQLSLFLLQEGDFRAIAQEVSCMQSIGGTSYFSLGMLARFNFPIEKHGAWFYKHLFWEAGMIGQLLYLEAENVGARGTGIGCYFDDEVHAILGIKNQSYQSMYHFTVGTPIEDPRLSTLPGYEQEDTE
jgi:nitroreductase